MDSRHKAPFLKKGEISKDLCAVGLGKPLGYDNFSLLANLSDDDIRGLRNALESRGLKTLVLRGPECAMRHGALYAYDEQALAALLQQRAGILLANNWPTDPEAFVRKIALEWVPEKTPLFDTIADTFNNKAHPGRTDVKVPDQHNYFTPGYLAYLKERERNPDYKGPVHPPP